MARVFVLHPGAGSDLRTTENHSCGGSGVHTCHLRPGGCGSKRVGVKGRSQLCNKFKASQSHLEVLSFKERKKEKTLQSAAGTQHLGGGEGEWFGQVANSSGLHSQILL